MTANMRLTRYTQALVRRRWMVLVATTLLTLGLGSQVTTLKLENNPDLWAPQNDAFIKTTHELENIFGGRNYVMIGVVARSGTIDQPAILEKIRRIQAGVEALPLAIKSNVLSLAARRVKDIRGDAEGMAVHQFLDPMPRTPEQLGAFEAAIARNPIYVGVLVSADRKAAAVVGDFHIPTENAAYAPLYEQISAIAGKERDDTVDIYLGGQPIFNANFEFAMQKMPLYFGVAFLIIMAIQFLVFRSFQGMLLPMVTAILSVVWGLGIMAILGVHMDALNTTTPILIMAVATGHSIQILKRYYEELGRLPRGGSAAECRSASRAAVAVSLAKVGPVMLTAGAIAAMAFFSLMITDVKMVRHFGLFAGSGILSVLAIELTFIPALRAIIPTKAPTQRENTMLDKLLRRIGDWLTRPAAAQLVVATAVLLLGISLYGAYRLNADNSVKQYNRPSSQVRRDDAMLNEKFGGTDNILFLVDGGTPDSLKDPRILEAMDKLESYLNGQPTVGKTQSLADLVKRMNRAMHQDDPAFDRIPDERNLVAQYLLLYSLSGDPQDFDNLVDNDYRKAALYAYLKTDSTASAMALYERCQQIIASAFPPGVSVRIGGGLPQTVAINDSLTRAKVKNIVQMAAMVFVLSSLFLRSLVGGLFVVIPLGAVVVANLGIMGWLGTPLDMGTATTTAMVTGIGADYEIYMLSRLKEEFGRYGNLNDALEASLLSSGKAVLFVALSVAGGYAALLMSDFLFYPRLGATMITTMLISALLSLLFLRAVVAVFLPKFIIGSSKAEPSLALGGAGQRSAR